MNTTFWTFKKGLMKNPLLVEKPDIVVIPDADYFVFKYGFYDGRDLDTFTELLSPVNEKPLGYSQIGNNTINIYSKWGGDNTGTGVETILIDVKKIKEDFPNNDVIEFRCGANWYGSRVSGNVTMNAFIYKGGVMSISNYDFINTGGNLISQFNFPTVNVTLNQPGSAPLASETVGVFRYTISTGILEKIS